MQSPGLLFDPRTWALPLADDACAFIQLSDRIDCFCLLDQQDYEWARAHLWCHTYGSGSFDENGVIARPDHIYARRCVGKATLFLHREILLRAEGPPPPGCNIGDHINGDTLDNRRSNLRWASRSQNARNRPHTRSPCPTLTKPSKTRRRTA
ncbi:MAG: HNH endonuclease signature motif containing protein [Methylorubrum rhodinum]|uniref:HNH endonuclease signature motif containing protein n=1 Tax=Methylorubrum rhodinum TaxID=29428 RepID=UPI003BB15A40